MSSSIEAPEAVEELEEALLKPAPSARAAQLALLSPRRAVAELAWPGIIEQLIRAGGQLIVFSFVSHLGAVQLAGVGAANAFLFLLLPLWQALSVGTIALVSRRMGEGRPEAASDVARQSIVLATIASVAAGVPFVLFAEPLLRAIGAAPDVAAVGAPYLQLVGGLNAFQTISIIGVSAMRAAGDTRTPMWLSATFTVLAVPFAFLLVDILEMGVLGAALASIVVSVLFMIATLALLWRGRADLTIAHGRWTVVPETTRAIAQISLPSFAESGLFSVSILAMGVLVFRLGTEAYAAHQIVFQVETISFLPCFGFSAAASALVGQSLGMRDPARARRAGWAAVQMAILWTASIGLLFALFPTAFLGAFTSDPGVLAAGLGAMLVLGFGQPAQGINFVLGGALRGAGDTRFTMVATIVDMLVVRFPLAVVLTFVVGLGLVGIWIAIIVDYCARTALLAWRFRSGKWQTLRY